MMLLTILLCALLCSDEISSVSAYSAAPRKVHMRTDEVHLSCRRTALAQLALVSSTPLAAYAVESSSVLETRLQENSIAPPPYGMESAETDIFYPQYFKGSWKAISKTKDIQAPCGLQLFTGGKAGFDSATQKEVIEGDTLQYRARFIEQGRNDDASSSYIAADREFNAKEIAKAAMGDYSVVDVPIATPNRFSCVLAGSANLICVDIITIARKTEPLSADKFACSEVVRQIVSPAQRNNPNAPPVPPLSVKEIETISVYTKLSDDKIQCRQRTATYLVPSQSDPMAFKKWQLSQGNSVDVRCYDVLYSRI